LALSFSFLSSYILHWLPVEIKKKRSFFIASSMIRIKKRTRQQLKTPKSQLKLPLCTTSIFERVLESDFGSNSWLKSMKWRLDDT
jgi:hypothetical protein